MSASSCTSQAANGCNNLRPDEILEPEQRSPASFTQLVSQTSCLIVYATRISTNRSQGPEGLLPVGLPAASVASASLSRLPERHGAFTDFCLCRAFGGMQHSSTKVSELRIDIATGSLLPSCMALHEACFGAGCKLSCLRDDCSSR